MTANLQATLELYDPAKPLAEASTIPASWYTRDDVAELERTAVFHSNWQMAGRIQQVREPGQYISANIAGAPILVVRGNDSILRGFYNVCRHHASAVVTDAAGCARQLRCPYHGWTYGLDGTLKGMTEFEDVCNFDPRENGLIPIAAEAWEEFVFVRLTGSGPTLAEHLGSLADRAAKLHWGGLHFFEQRRWVIDCNWKVYADNYLDGGYHVPQMHKGLNSVLNYSKYTVETDGRVCIQTTPLRSTEQSDPSAAGTRRGDRGYYFWLYPNFMMNYYAGVMDTNLVLPHGPNQCEVVFDYYFEDISAKAEAFNCESMAVAGRVQDEDIAICHMVQGGLRSGAYQSGRLSVRREAGEHLFHRLLFEDLQAGLARTAS